jgi:hypothetical protein
MGNEKYEGKITCEWRIILPLHIKWAELTSIKEGTDNVIKLHQYAQCHLKKLNKDELPQKYSLTIRGRGNDQRCAWCRYFRKSLAGHYNKQNVGIIQHGACIYE